MKKVIVFLIFFVSFVNGFSQAVSPAGSNTNTIMYPNLGATRSLIMPAYLDTFAANNNYPTLDSTGKLIFTYSLNTVWVRSNNPKRWVPIGSGSSSGNPDTIYTALPLYVDTISDPPKRILKILHADGLVSPGIVTKADCWTLDVTSALYYIGFRQFVSLSSTVTIDTANATLPRYDLVIVDTNSTVSVLKGTASATPMIPQINPSSQVALSAVYIPAAATCLNVTTEVVYDENIEWTTGSTGTISVDYNNTDNPYHLTKAAFAVTYTNGSSMTFTDTGLDTVSAGEILKMFVYLNGLFTNDFQLQFFRDATPVSNSISINSSWGLNPLDSNAYQNLSIPFYAFVFSSPVFNKLVIKYAGDDISGAKGLYIDYIQLQKGNSNPYVDFSNKVDSVTKSTDSLFYWVNGVSHFVGTTGSGGSVTANNGLNVNTGSNVQIGGSLLKGTTIASGDSSLTITGTSTNTAYAPLVIANTTANTSSISLIVNHTSGTGISLNGTTGRGVSAITTTGTAISGTNSSGTAISGSSTTGIGIQSNTGNSGSNTPSSMQVGSTYALGTSNGAGVKMDFTTTTNSGGLSLNGQISNSFISRWNNAIDGNRTSQLEITGVDNASTKTWMILDSVGIRIPDGIMLTSGNGGDSVVKRNSSTGQFYLNPAASSDIPGINDVLSVNQFLQSNQEIVLDGSTLTMSGGNVILPDVPIGSSTDSVMTIDGAGIIKKRNASSFGGGITSVTGTANRITSSGGSTPAIDISGSYVGQSSITTLGTIGSGVWNGTTVGSVYGGTGQSTYTTGDVLYASATNTLSKLPIGTSKQTLHISGGVPAWRDTAVSGTALSGTGLVSASGASISYNTTSASIAGIISDETGTGSMVFGTNPTITTGMNLVGSGGADPKISYDIPSDGLIFQPTNTDYPSVLVLEPNGSSTQSYIELSSSSVLSNSEQLYFGGGFSGAPSGAWTFGSTIYGTAAANSRPIAFVVSNTGAGRIEAARITNTGIVGIGTNSPNASSLLDISSTTKGLLIPRMTTTQMNAVSSPAAGLKLYNSTSGTDYTYNGSAFKTPGIVSGSFSGVGTATTTFTVTFGGTQPNSTYKVIVTPTAALSAALFYVTNKTTTTFDVTYLAGLTGTVTFDWAITQ